MKRAVYLAVPLLAVLTACSAEVKSESMTLATNGAQTAAPTTTTSAGAPPEPRPAVGGQCPYLKTSVVEDANGQRVSKVKLSADQVYPACFFYHADGKEQLTVWVYDGDPRSARAIVDRAAPVDGSSKASLAGGWEGGSVTNDAGLTYAVAKAGAAVVVTSNQKQSIKGRRITEQVIRNLGL